MALDVQGQVGERTISDGSENILRTGRTGELVTGDGKGRYAEMAERGRLYSACTAAAGVAPGTALSTTPPLAIWNPPNSGVNLHLIRARLAFVSGTLGAGTLALGVVASQLTSPAGTGVTARNTKTGLTGVATVHQAGTLSSTPLLLMPVGSITAVAAATAFAPLVGADVELGGEVLVPPGAAACLQGIAAAGTSPLVILGLLWAEMPV